MPALKVNLNQQRPVLQSSNGKKETENVSAFRKRNVLPAFS